MGTRLGEMGRGGTFIFDRNIFKREILVGEVVGGWDLEVESELPNMSITWPYHRYC